MDIIKKGDTFEFYITSNGYETRVGQIVYYFTIYDFHKIFNILSVKR